MQVAQMEQMLNNDPVVDKAYSLKGEYLGPGNVAVSADIDFEGQAITRRYIERSTSEVLAKWQPGMRLAEQTAWYPSIEGGPDEVAAVRPRVPQSADPRPRPAQCAPLSPNLEPAVQVAAMVEQHGLSAQQQADRKQQVLSELRARIGDMDDEEFCEFLEAFGDAIIDSTCPRPPPAASYLSEGSYCLIYMCCLVLTLWSGARLQVARDRSAGGWDQVYPARRADR